MFVPCTPTSASHLPAFTSLLQAGRDGASVAYGTLRDWEWLDVAMSVDVSEEDKARLGETVSADAAFLASQVRF